MWHLSLSYVGDVRLNHSHLEPNNICKDSNVLPRSLEVTGILALAPRMNKENKCSSKEQSCTEKDSMKMIRHDSSKRDSVSVCVWAHRRVHICVNAHLKKNKS